MAEFDELVENGEKDELDFNEIIKKYKQAGKIAADAREFGRKLVKENASVLETSDKIEEYILKHANLAFPVQISRNDIAAHYCSAFEDKLVFKELDLVKIDIGVHVDGYIADTSISVSVGNSEINDFLIKAANDALNDALKIIKPGVSLGEIGKTIQNAIAKYNLSPVKNLCGHGLKRYTVHSRPSVPNYNTNDKTTLKENAIIAIEPFATNGAGMIYDSGNPEIFSLSMGRNVRSNITREILKEIEHHHNLPFAKRWLVKKFGLGKVNFAFNELGSFGMIKEHAPLIDKMHGLVSQAEHTIIVMEKPIITTISEE